MGTWASGPFANDAAADFIRDLSGQPRRAEKALVAILTVIAEYPPAVYLDVDDGHNAHAAAALVALAFGWPGPDDAPDAALELAEVIRPGEALRGLAVRALDRIVVAPSELLSLWEGTAGEPLAGVKELRSWLSAVNPKQRRAPTPKLKVGDVLEVSHAGDVLVVQLVAPQEIVVFHGLCTSAEDALAIVAARTGTRTPCDVRELARRGRVVRNVKLRPAFKDKKLYASEGYGHAVEEYELVDAGKYRRVADYQEAKEYDLFARRSLSEWAPFARGAAPGPLRSPDQREAAIRAAARELWAQRRACTTPGPFGDPEVIEELIKFVEQRGVRCILEALLPGDDGRAQVGESEFQQRWAYIKVGLLALWLGSWTGSEIPEHLRATLPAKPAQDLRPYFSGACMILERILERDSVLRMMWFEAEDGGAEFRACAQALRAALSS